MKFLTIAFLCNIISINLINADKCYVCDDTGCDRPGPGNIQDCTDSELGGKSGKTFVNGALGKNDPSNAYISIQNDFNTSIALTGINQSLVPAWNSLTQWVCYVTKDKRRGCLIMGKGLCSGDKTWLGQITNIADKIKSIMDKAADAIGKMFTDKVSQSLNNTQKANISTWFAGSYMSKLINNSADPQFQLDSCCEGDSCNFASMIEKSIVVIILLGLSTFILI